MAAKGLKTVKRELSDGKNKEQVPLLENEVVASVAAKHKKNNGHVLLRYQLDRG